VRWAIALVLFVGLIAGPTARAGRERQPGELPLVSRTAASQANPKATSRIAAAASDIDPAALELRVGIQRASGGSSIVTLPLETYVARVLAGEAARDSRPAALEALAITVRTYAMANRGRHRAEGFDLCDQTHCQVLRTALPVHVQAALATAGRVLAQDGVPASVYYTASCGGRTEIPSAVWPGAEDPPYLPSRPDDACRGEPAWTADIAGRDLFRALSAGGFRGDRLGDMRIVSRDVSGRVARLRLDGLNPPEISGQDLRVVVGRTLGWQYVKSTAFELRHTGDSYQFSGHGYGHGVGLCVIGSVRLAEAGRSAATILDRYFPGLEIVALGGRVAPAAPAASIAEKPGPAPTRVHSDVPQDVLVLLPDEDEGEQGLVSSMTLRARDDLARLLSRPVPPRVVVRFHPTVDSYAKTTGGLWFTSGTVANGEVQLPPIAVLRDRGVLERTIRQQLVHLLVDDQLKSRPRWVRDGAAMYFSDQIGEAAPQSDADARARIVQPRSSCPDDNELSSPVSAGALTNSLARARACFARQVAAGRSWRDVR
jgi:SpoIID/LytB domain protein